MAIIGNMARLVLMGNSGSSIQLCPVAVWPVYVRTSFLVHVECLVGMVGDWLYAYMLQPDSQPGPF